MDHPRTIDLLLAHEGGVPVLDHTCDVERVGAGASPVAVTRPDHLRDLGENASRLDRQRWAVMVPDTDEGTRLRALVQPLVERRAEQQGAPVLTVRAPPGMSAPAAMRWKLDRFPALYGYDELRCPRYLLMLGDLDGLSLATQQVFSIDHFPGRVACSQDAGYQAYADKVVRHDSSPSTHERARSLFYTVHDGTNATRQGYEKLMQPCYQHCQTVWQTDQARFPASQVCAAGAHQGPDPSEFLALARADEPTLMFSLSHGLGPSPGQAWGPQQARERQGAMVFGSRGPLMPSEVAQAPFLPGGLWFYFACFGAGTPGHSSYQHWLESLVRVGAVGGAQLRACLRGLAHQGGFISGIAKAALANPSGPLGIVGHIDLAWSYSYEELRIDGGLRVRSIKRHSNYYQLLQRLLSRYEHAPGDRRMTRLGVSILELQKTIANVGAALNEHYGLGDRRSARTSRMTETIALCHLWMQYQDLRGYLILGDPAVHLPLSPTTGPSIEGIQARFMAGLAGGSAPPASDPGGPDAPIDGLERALLEQLLGRRRSADIAQRYRVAADDIDAWARAYREAGRTALRDLTDIRQPDHK